MATTATTTDVIFEAVLRDITIDGAAKTIENPAIRQRLSLAGLKVWGGTFSGVAPSATTVLDLFGSLTDSNGAVINWASINMIVVQNRRTDAGAWVKVGPNTAGNPFGSPGFWETTAGRSQIDEESLRYWYSKPGVAVTDSSADELAIITSAVVDSDNVFDVLIAGPGA